MKYAALAISAAAAIALITGCSGSLKTGLTLSPQIQSAVQKIVTVSVADIAAADKAAVAGNDAAAHQCFAFLGPWVQAQAASLSLGNASVSGVVSGFEAARLAYRQGSAMANAGIPDAVSQNCGWLAASVNTDITGLLLQLASKAPVVALP
jgi:hypothetical protein